MEAFGGSPNGGSMGEGAVGGSLSRRARGRTYLGRLGQALNWGIR